jgi:hypothetical protein
MTIKKVETDKVHYILYARGTSADYETLKTYLAALSGKGTGMSPKDIVVDLHTMTGLFSNEIGTMIATAKKIRDESRKLIVLASAELIDSLVNTTVYKVDNLIFQDNKLKAEPHANGEDPTHDIRARGDIKVEIRCTNCDYMLWTMEKHAQRGLPTCVCGHAMTRY